MKKLIIIFAIFISGCVNQNQKITINADGSGYAVINYSTAVKNLSAGDEVGGFKFSESKIRETYSSENSEITNLKIDKNEKDSIVDVIIEINFKDFNKLSDAQGFSKSITEWKAENDIYRFKYFILKDSLNASVSGMNDFHFKYEFSFPGLVAETNGTKDGTEKETELKTERKR